MPTANYIYSHETLAKAETYLGKILSNPNLAGKHLDAILKNSTLVEKYLQRIPTKDQPLTAHELIVLLMNTRKPRIFAESEVSWKKQADWTAEEGAILADVSYYTEGTSAYNNGIHGLKDIAPPITHYVPKPLPVNFLFVSSALLRNSNNPEQTCDMSEVLATSGTIDPEAFYKLYERRLLPGLLAQNAAAKASGKKLVINFPGLGLGQFAGNYALAAKNELPIVLKRLFETHGAVLDQVSFVNYDPFLQAPNQEFTGTAHGMRLDTCPLQTSGSKSRGQLAYPQAMEADYAEHPEQFQLLKIVAWDPFSYPGNDIWGNARVTDDGVSFASSDVLHAMFESRQLVCTPDKSVQFTEASYHRDSGTFFAVTEDEKPIYYSALVCENDPIATMIITPAMVSLGGVGVELKSGLFPNSGPDIMSDNMENTTSELIERLNAYKKQRNAVTDSTGNRKEYYGLSIFQSAYKSATKKNEAVDALIRALQKDGSVTTLAKHMHTLRDGELGRILRDYIQNQNTTAQAMTIINHSTKIKTVRAFVDALDVINSAQKSSGIAPAGP